MTPGDWFLVAVIAGLILWVIWLSAKNRELEGMLMERTEKIRDTIITVQRAKEHTAIPYSRFLQPPSRPLRHSAPNTSIPLNLPIIQQWDSYDERDN